MAGPREHSVAEMISLMQDIEIKEDVRDLLEIDETGVIRWGHVNVFLKKNEVVMDRDIVLAVKKKLHNEFLAKKLQAESLKYDRALESNRRAADILARRITQSDEVSGGVATDNTQNNAPASSGPPKDPQHAKGPEDWNFYIQIAKLLEAVNAENAKSTVDIIVQLALEHNAKRTTEEDTSGLGGSALLDGAGTTDGTGEAIEDQEHQQVASSSSTVHGAAQASALPNPPARNYITAYDPTDHGAAARAQYANPPRDHCTPS